MPRRLSRGTSQETLRFVSCVIEGRLQRLTIGARWVCPSWSQEMTHPLETSTGDARPNGSLPAARILVVDDDESLRRAISRTLELEGYELEVATDGLQALTFFDEGCAAPELVVLDI